MRAANDAEVQTRHTEFHRFVEDHVERTPDRCAIHAAGVALSYGELNAQSNRLARHLRQMGLGPDSIVGICLPRSTDLLVSALAVLKAGAAFLPLDPAYPAEWVDHVVRDAAPSAAITLSSLSADLRRHTRVLALDIDRTALAAAGSGNLEPVVDGGNLAYVIYTSGTTGRPKGTLLTHGSLCNYAIALQELGITPADVYLCTASAGFSSSIRQLLMPLCFGASVVMAGTDEIADPTALIALVRERQVTIADLVPSYWRTCTRVLQRLPVAERVRLLDNRLRLILSASEPLTSDVPRVWRREFTHAAEFVNGYGHTETTGLIALHRVTAECLAATQAVPIGHPLPATDVVLLRGDGVPPAVGEHGELYVRGPCLARGYLNRPDLEAETFLADPPGLPGGRWYRTGDIVRRLPDGNLLFVGRHDLQVKIHGVRVEIAAVESALREHAAVHDAAVVVDREDPQDGRLRAFVVAEDLADDGGSHLRAFLSERLPAPMIPGEFVLVPSIPRTPSGKIDRPQVAMLRAPAVTPVARRPMSDLELSVAAEWRRLLLSDRIDVTANFFEVGGDSLKAMELVAALQQKHPTEVPMLALFFEDPTVEGLARSIQETSLDQQHLRP